MSPDESPELLDKVKGWLRSKGYPLEMATARAFLNRGMAVRQGWTYDDHETGTPREIDVLASTTVTSERAILLLQAIVECKWSTDPFVAFTYGQRLARAIHFAWLPANPAGRAFLKGVAAPPLAPRIPLFQPVSPVAYSLRQARLDKRDSKARPPDAAFDALMSAIKASLSLARLYTDRVREMPAPSDPSVPRPLAYLGFPVLVIDAPLVGASMDDGGDLAMQSLEKVIVEWSHPLVGTLMALVVTSQALAPFTDQLLQSAILLQNEAAGVLERIFFDR